MPRAAPDAPDPSPNEERSHWGRDFGRYAGLGLSYAATIGILAAAGYWLDGRFGTFPALLIAGVFLGFVGGTVSLVRRVSPGAGRPARPK